MVDDSGQNSCPWVRRFIHPDIMSKEKELNIQNQRRPHNYIFKERSLKVGHQLTQRNESLGIELKAWEEI